jgi:uncharacterized protein YbjT (DUF2867 family)
MNDVLMLGATGLVGALALPPLLERARVHAVGRRAPVLVHPGLDAIVAPLEDPSRDAALERELRAKSSGALGAFVCCVGTTIRVAGSQEAFVAVDRTLVARVARIARALGARQAIVVSSVGADPRSRNFYLAVTGAMEDDVAALGFARCDFLRPGLLLGERAQRRGAERLFQSLAWAYNPLLHGRALSRYRAIDAARVAGAIAALLGRDGNGRFVHENASIDALKA